MIQNKWKAAKRKQQMESGKTKESKVTGSGCSSGIGKGCQRSGLLNVSSAGRPLSVNKQMGENLRKVLGGNADDHVEMDEQTEDYTRRLRVHCTIKK